MHSGAGTCYPIQANNGNYYMTYLQGGAGISGGAPTFNYVKSPDKIQWSVPSLIQGSVTGDGICNWYDRWSGISADLIYVGMVDSTNDDITFRTINTASADALGTQTVVLAGATTAVGKSISIVRGRGTNIVVAGSIDAGAEDGAWESSDAGATWASAIADPSEAATQDQYFLLPGWNADTEDQMLLFWDASANELSVKRYDNSANSWAETTISGAGAAVDQVATTAYPHFAATIDLINSQNVILFWNAIDAANADLKCYTVTDSAVTAKTDVVANGTDDQGLCAIGIATDTGYWHAFYTGKSDGSETYPTATNLYRKISTDAGTAWGAEEAMTTVAGNITWLACAPRFTGDPFVCWIEESADTPEEGFYTVVDIPAGGLLVHPGMSGGCRG